jgi:6-phosphogluconolactonase
MITPTMLEAETEEEFIARGTALLADMIRTAIASRGECVLGLSGGSTPRRIYARLAAEELDWAQLRVFLVDERHIDPSNPESNAYLVRETLCIEGALSPEHLMLPDTSLPPEDCAAAYGKSLDALFAEHGTPDLVTLGLGEDGHIASLFPPLPDRAFGPASAIHTTTDRFAVHDRISVTLPILRQTPEVFFFLKGEGKRKVWQEMLTSNDDAKRWPAKSVMEFGKTTVLFLR